MATNAKCEMVDGCVLPGEMRDCGHVACDGHTDVCNRCMFCVDEQEEALGGDDALEWQAEQERGFLERFEARARYQAETTD